MEKEQLEKLFNMKENVLVEVRDKNGTVIGKTTIRNNIFRPCDGGFKEYESRFNRIHKFVKQRVVHTGLKVLQWLIGKYLIKSIDDIPKEPANNMVRIFYHSYMQGLEESFKKVHYDWQIKQGHNYNGMTRDEAWIHWKTNSQHCNARILLLNLWMTEVMEDTFDRAVTELAMIESYHQIRKLYKNKVSKVEDYGVYDSHNARDIRYFVDKNNEGVWDK